MDQYTKNYTGYANGVSVEQQTVSLYKSMYLWMSMGLGMTALTSFVVMKLLYQSDQFAEVFLSSTTMIMLMIASFVMVFALGGMINRISFIMAHLLFCLYSVIMGAWLTPMLLLYTSASVTKVFLITAGTFGGMAVYGHFTNRDLSSIGRICYMALWGVILASIVNIFMGSSMMDYVISYLAVAIFCGITMYDVQKFKTLLLECGDAGDSVRKIALLGALTLYLDFLNLFIHLLRILGQRK